MGKKQRTLSTLEELRDWIETHPHHVTELQEEKRRIVVQNHHEMILVPQDLWEQAPLRPGGRFDNRMWRWGKEPPLTLWVHPDVMRSTYVFPIENREMASRLRVDGWVPLGELL